MLNKFEDLSDLHQKKGILRLTDPCSTSTFCCIFEVGISERRVEIYSAKDCKQNLEQSSVDNNTQS